MNIRRLMNSSSFTVLFSIFTAWPADCQTLPTFKSCASIYLKNATDPAAVLYPNEKIDNYQLQKVQSYPPEIFRLEIGKNYEGLATCVLQLCVTWISYVDCVTLTDNTSVPEHWYSDSAKFWSHLNQPSLTATFNDRIFISNARCLCNANSKRIPQCQQTVCNQTNESIKWKDFDCAILYPENGCHTCFFDSTPINDGYVFNELRGANRFQSFIIRPGCTLTMDGIREDNGSFTSKPMQHNFTGILEARNSIYWSPERVQCSCKRDANSTDTDKPGNVSNYFLSSGSTYVITVVAIIVTFGLYAILLIMKAKNVNTSKQTCIDTQNLEQIGTSHEVLELEFVSKFQKLLYQHENCNSPDQNSFNGPNLYTAVNEKLKRLCGHQVIPRDSIIVPKFNYENPVGGGESSKVYKGFIKLQCGELKQVAVKHMKFEDFFIKCFFREVETFMNTTEGNENVVRFYGACSHSDGLYLLTEFCGKGSLRQHIYNKLRPKYAALKLQLPPNCPVELETNYIQVDWETQGQSWACSELEADDLFKILVWCAQIAAGMKFLAQKKIIHVDLAARNVLLSEDMTIKICDLGLAKKCLNDESGARSLTIDNFPINSLAPEVITECPSTPKPVSLHIDVWSYGCLLWEIFTLCCKLYPIATEPGFVRLLTIRTLLYDGYRHPKPQFAPDIVYEMMLACWNEIPRSRPPFSELEEFFKSLVNDVTL